MNEQSPASFDNTEIAFAAKSNKDLKKAQFLFSAMGKAWLVKLGLKITPLAIKWHIPFTRTMIRNTIFQQFVGGETLEETAKVADKLEEYNVKVILDYGVEGKESEADFEQARDEFCKVISYAATQANIPLMSVKVTGFGRFALLERLDTEMSKLSGTLMKRYLNAVESLPAEDKEEFHRVRLRLLQVCEQAEKKNQARRAVRCAECGWQTGVEVEGADGSVGQPESERAANSCVSGGRSEMRPPGIVGEVRCVRTATLGYCVEARPFVGGELQFVEFDDDGLG